MKTNKFWRYSGFGVLGIIGLIGFTFVVMWLWNWLVPELFKGPELSYWQTLGLLVLSKIIFSGIGSGSKHRHPSHGHDFPPMPKSRWRQKYEAKMNGKVEVNMDAADAASGQAEDVTSKE